MHTILVPLIIYEALVSSADTSGERARGGWRYFSDFYSKRAHYCLVVYFNAK